MHFTSLLTYDIRERQGGQWKARESHCKDTEASWVLVLSLSPSEIQSPKNRDLFTLNPSTYNVRDGGKEVIRYFFA